jgi:putative two-component system response regulator
MTSAAVLPEMVREARILIVDDEAPIRQSLSRLLEREGFQCTLAANAAEARHLLDTEQFEMMLCDVTMPGESGFSLLAYSQKAHPDTAVIMVTAVASPRATAPAAGSEPSGYIMKPFGADTIVLNVNGVLHQRAERIAERSRRAPVEKEMADRLADLDGALADLALADMDLSSTDQDTILGLAQSAESRHCGTSHRLQWLSEHSARLALLANLEAGHVERVRIASQMHDIGKIGLPEGILLKPGPLTLKETLVVHAHPEIGHRMLARSRSPVIQLAAVIALTHHEWFDGTGYPRGLSGSAIPIESRVVALGDVYDALRNESPYKRAFSRRDSLAILNDRRGTQFDPELLDLFVNDIEATAHT